MVVEKEEPLGVAIQYLLGVSQHKVIRQERRASPLVSLLFSKESVIGIDR
jgi:hypothetical protein